MSFYIELKAQGGEVSFGTVSGEVPDGGYVISGHADAATGALTSIHADATLAPKAAE